MLKRYTDFDTYHKITFHVFVGDFDEFNRVFVEETDDDYFEKGARGWCYFNEHERTTYIWIERLDIATIIHEVNHAVMYIFDSLGITYNAEYSEHFCIYSEYIAQLFEKVK